ncbi:hypothetical protein HYQ44_018003 [Verticillium longisporum]|nr:hypothetical protein HYQ44_018003 [Verticillium longisporum]
MVSTHATLSSPQTKKQGPAKSRLRTDSAGLHWLLCRASSVLTPGLLQGHRNYSINPNLRTTLSAVMVKREALRVSPTMQTPKVNGTAAPSSWNGEGCDPCRSRAD